MEDRPCQGFDFLGYTFRLRSARSERGEFFESFSPAMSPEASCTLRQTIRGGWNLSSRTCLSMAQMACWLNPVISGWVNYHGRFCRSVLYSAPDHINSALAKWAMRKIKRLRRRKIRAYAWLKGVAWRSPRLFTHRQYQSWMTRAI